MARNIGLDLGSGKTSIVLRGRGTVLCEPTVAVINEEAEEMVAIGEKAAQMIGKVPPELSVCYPVRFGSVVHCDEACFMNILRARRAPCPAKRMCFARCPGARRKLSAWRWRK